ncbi:small RNA-binding protein 11, chloroplastic isoform X2 [Macadamia integrifolia]|uniref:small RNA-binding protein 11, chloroplastic isoform X2 n=1 Tax=Macadamia integrifolia TaxID=60698 RepID=UPI001C4FA6C1|nr:small RNA-binding protein 11, chloroplastic isoform X2 [Macadamia integrifolia]
MLGAVSFASFPTPRNLPRSQLCPNMKPTCMKAFKVTASLTDFPLASRILVRNLPYSISETSLSKEFSNFGQVVEVKLVKDDATQRSKGYAFVQYTSQNEAMLALENMDHKTLDGRVIYVDLAKPVNNSFGSYPITSGPPSEQNS